MKQKFTELTQKYLENAKKYNALSTAIKSDANLTREQLVAKLKEVALFGNQIVEESKDLMLMIGLIDKRRNPAPEFSVSEAYELFDFARKLNKSCDRKKGIINDHLLALEILEVVFQTADKHDDVVLKILSSEWLAHHCLNHSLLEKQHKVCDEILKIPYESIPNDIPSSAEAKLTYALMVFCYSPMGIVFNAGSSFDEIFECFRHSESFHDKYKPPTGPVFDITDDDAWAQEWERPEVKKWIETLSVSATEEQARLYMEQWFDYAKNISILKTFACRLCYAKPISLEQATELKEVCGNSLENEITAALSAPYDAGSVDALKSGLTDGKKAVMIVGWVAASIEVAKNKGEPIELYLKALQNIAFGILSIPDVDDWYTQIEKEEALLTACVILCMRFTVLPDEEQTIVRKIADDTALYIQRQSKEVKSVIDYWYVGFSVMINSCPDMPSRRKYVNFFMGIAAQDHIPTYAHSLVVARLNKTVTEYALRFAPELLVGIADTKNVDEVKAISDDENLRNSFIKEMEFVGLWHDLGKVCQLKSVSQCVRPLTDTEYLCLIRRHNEIGKAILNIEGFELQQACAEKHHAYAVGNGFRGYPANQEGESVSDSPYKSAINITHISDVLSAISDNLGRYYAKPRSVDEAFEQILKDSESINGNIELDPDVVNFILENKELKSQVREVLTSYNEEAYWTAYCELIKG